MDGPAADRNQEATVYIVRPTRGLCELTTQGNLDERATDSLIWELMCAAVLSSCTDAAGCKRGQSRMYTYPKIESRPGAFASVSASLTHAVTRALASVRHEASSVMVVLPRPALALSRLGQPCSHLAFERQHNPDTHQASSTRPRTPTTHARS